MKKRNHYDDSGDLVVEQRTLFRQVGWFGQTTSGLYRFEWEAKKAEKNGSYSPVYVAIAVDRGEGWDD